jgi:hypothetical protein
MIDATIPFHLSAADLPTLKKAEALHLLGVQSRHLVDRVQDESVRL